MKQLLITLSTLTTLTLTSSIINTIDVTNTTVNKLLTINGRFPKT